MSSSQKRSARPARTASNKKINARPAVIKQSFIARLISSATSLFKSPATTAGKTQAQGSKTGIVKFFNRSKGFGFIQEDNGAEVFVHVSGLLSDIRMNDRVSFVTEPGKRGMHAVNVAFISR